MPDAVESTVERVQDSLSAKSVGGVPNYVWAGGGGLLIAFLLWRRGSVSKSAVAASGADSEGAVQREAVLVSAPSYPTSPGQPGMGGPYSGQPGSASNPITFPTPPGGWNPNQCPDGGCASCPLGGSCQGSGSSGGGTQVGAPITIPPAPAPAPISVQPYAVINLSPRTLQAGQPVTVSVQSVAGDVDSYEVATAVSDDGAAPTSGWQTWYEVSPARGDTRTVPTSPYEGYATNKYLHAVVNLKKNGAVVAGGSPNVVGYTPLMHDAITLMPRL